MKNTGRLANPAVSIGIIADTHGLLRPEAIDALRGVAHILHAGDVGGREIVEALEKIAPVTVVRGNCDNDVWGKRLPLSEIVEIAGVWCGVFHGHLSPDTDYKAAGARLVVTGHTHIAKIETCDGLLRLNPGSAGPRRFPLPVTLARVAVGDDSRLTPEIITLTLGADA